MEIKVSILGTHIDILITQCADWKKWSLGAIKEELIQDNWKFGP